MNHGIQCLVVREPYHGDWCVDQIVQFIASRALTRIKLVRGQSHLAERVRDELEQQLRGKIAEIDEFPNTWELSQLPAFIEDKSGDGALIVFVGSSEECCVLIQWLERFFHHFLPDQPWLNSGDALYANPEQHPAIPLTG